MPPLRTAAALLRGVAVAAGLQGLGHGALFLRARPTHGPDEVLVVAAMQTHAFRFGGAPRTYWDMYLGYGLEAAAICLIEALLFWHLAGAVRRHAAVVRPIAGLFALANLLHIGMLARYFAFPLPIAFDLLIAAGLTAALYLTGLRAQPEPITN